MQALVGVVAVPEEVRPVGDVDWLVWLRDRVCEPSTVGIRYGDIADLRNGCHTPFEELLQPRRVSHRASFEAMNDATEHEINGFDGAGGLLAERAAEVSCVCLGINKNDLTCTNDLPRAQAHDQGCGEEGN